MSIKIFCLTCRRYILNTTDKFVLGGPYDGSMFESSTDDTHSATMFRAISEVKGGDLICPQSGCQFLGPAAGYAPGALLSEHGVIYPGQVSIDTSFNIVQQEGGMAGHLMYIKDSIPLVGKCYSCGGEISAEGTYAADNKGFLCPECMQEDHEIPEDAPEMDDKKYKAEDFTRVTPWAEPKDEPVWGRGPGERLRDGEVPKIHEDGRIEWPEEAEKEESETKPEDALRFPPGVTVKTGHRRAHGRVYGIKNEPGKESKPEEPPLLVCPKCEKGYRDNPQGKYWYDKHVGKCEG